MRRQETAMTSEAMRAHLREQVHICRALGSPFTAELMARMATDFDAGGPIADLVGAWAGSPRVDVVGLRLCGALHAAVLAGSDPALAAQYPAQRADWDIEAVWPLAHAFLRREQASVAAFIRSAPQTNEVRRAIALLPGFLTLAREYDGPIDTLEIGASAGLNLNWDRFCYRTATWGWGPSAGVAIDTDWSGPAPPLDAVPRIRSRSGCDLNPADLTDPAQRLQLRSYIWPDQHERLARFDAAVELALATGVRVARADAAEWLAQRLAQRRFDAATIVYHSVFLQYPPREKSLAIVAAIEAAGERATPQAPLAWLRLEPEAVLGGPGDSLRFLVDLVTWPGGTRRLLAITDGHARAVSCQLPS